jgi:hypothetical protein
MMDILNSNFMIHLSEFSAKEDLSNPKIKGQIQQQRSDKGTLLIFRHED